MFRMCKYLLLCLALTAISQISAAQIQYLNSSGALPPGLPFSEAVRVGDTLYLSGQLGVVPGKLELVPGGMAAEARQAMENIQTVLKANDLDMKNIVKCTIMLADMAQWGEFNKVYASFFSPPFPARSAFGASGLGLGAQVEIDCIASYL